MERGYQTDFLKNSKVAQEKFFHKQGREQKAQKIKVILEEHLGSLSEKEVLDIGASTGIISNYLAEHVHHVWGVDIDQAALEYAQEHRHDKADFKVDDSLNLSFANETFDIVICAQIYEHVPCAQTLFDEIYRVLKPGGVCFLSALNKFKVMEPHYRLPFLSYLPKPLAHKYLQWTKKGSYYYETPYTLWTLKKMLKQFQITDYSLKVIQNPEAYAATDVVPGDGLKRKIVQALAPALYPLMPSFLWVLTKEPAS